MDTALREAAEEIAVDRSSVDAVALLPRLHIRASGFDVTAVLAHWRVRNVLAVDATETLGVACLPLTDLDVLADWYELHHPIGWSGYALDHRVGTIWGYTADLVRAVVGAGPPSCR